ncbi:hypothetical protein C5Z26_05225 [Lactobacillus sp. CBA3606]|uniref:hypothetical protein n=1 Tax=Lactobacillus sp. CBA3606 TaxID=2099789 RepID=UPI000CFD8503|nr:hypothetical protein [Lactobacillus sp. CBA3606]AVK63541.1 hypothetical protein C5Z26_05225 [Lactobacillus sp. CBA3606]
MKQLIWNNLLLLATLLGIPALFAWVLTLINRQTKAHLVSRFGINSQVYLGCLGIIIHELSHLIMAVIFRHGIQSIRLIKRPHLHQTTGNPDDLALGYVNHTWRQGNYYQMIGNLFIGVAPIFGCTASLLGLDAWLFPGLSRAILTLAATPKNPNWHGSWTALTTAETSWWQLGLLLILTILIVIGGFDLSPADYQNSALGLMSTVILIIVFTTIITLLDGQATAIFTSIITFGFTIAIILSYALVVSLIVLIITRLIAD